MSQRHDDAFRTIRREHDILVAAIRQVSGRRKRGAPGLPDYDPERLEDVILTAGDAYALLLIATAEAYLREYLLGIGVSVGSEPRLGTLIDRSVKELNRRTKGTPLRPTDKAPIHALRMSRNQYAHGHARSVFPAVAKVEDAVSRFLSPFP